MDPTIKAPQLKASSEPGPGGDWPRTTRVLPWLLAGFVVMLWLIPFHAIRLPIDLPFDMKLDRLLLIGIGVIWFAAAATRGPASPVPRRSAINWAVVGFTTLAIASVVLNSDTLVINDELDFSLKKIAQLLAYIWFFQIVATTMRPAEVPRYITLMLVLACLTAAGTIAEFRNDNNVFHTWSAKVFAPLGMTVEPDRSGVDSIGRKFTNGPTGHALAVATMLSFAAAFALVGFLRSERRRQKAFHAFVVALCLAGAMATARKTGALVPAVILLTLFAYRPRAAIKLLPLGIFVIIVIQALAPGTLGTVRKQLTPDRLSRDAPVQGRKLDYAAVAPEANRHPALGRGFGSYDAEKYRFLDNQYLGLRLEVGFLGTAAYILLILAVFLAAHKVVMTRDPKRAPPAIAVACAAAAFAVSSAFFDVISFPHTSYMFLFLAALTVVLRSPETSRSPVAVRPLRLEPFGPQEAAAAGRLS